MISPFSCQAVVLRVWDALRTSDGACCFDPHVMPEIPDFTSVRVLQIEDPDVIGNLAYLRLNPWPAADLILMYPGKR